jgi:hypothetical protein
MGQRIDRLRRRVSAIPGDVGRVLKGLVNRAANLWTRARDGAFSLGQTYNRDDPYYEWELGATEKHCRDCLMLNGRVHKASDWRLLGWQPQSPDLECGGFNCDCRFTQVAGPQDDQETN